MSSSGSRRAYLAALGTGIVVIAASTYGVSLTRAAESLPDTATSAGVTAPAVGPASMTDGATAAAPSPAAPSSLSMSSVGSSSGSPSSGSPSSTGPSAASSAPATVSARNPGSPSRSSSDAPTASAPSSRSVPAPSTSTPASTPPPSTPPPPTTAAPAPATQFKDGTYSATAEYNSPGGVQKVGVTLTLAGDVVTGSSLELYATGIAKAYQNLFQQNYSPQVTGKKIDTIQLGAVGGSSLTAGGFNEALKAIEEQAHA